jgi:fatty acid desaturase
MMVMVVVMMMMMMVVRQDHHGPLHHRFVDDGAVRDRPMHNRARVGRGPRLAHHTMNDGRGMMNVL